MISDNKLKVMLCQEDLKQFELKADQLDYSNTDTKRMFWDVLSKAKHQTGFDTDGQRVLVQLYPSKEGGCEMFVTKIGLLSTADTQKYANQDKNNNHLFLTSGPQKKNNNSTLNLFSFDKTEDLLNVCRRLEALGYIGESSAYSAPNGQKYLLLSDVDFDDYTPPDEFSFILEYAKLEKKENFNYYLAEHGKAICDFDAVSVLSRL